MYFVPHVLCFVPVFDQEHKHDWVSGLPGYYTFGSAAKRKLSGRERNSQGRTLEEKCPEEKHHIQEIFTFERFKSK